jgi:hypothetical protein
MAYWGFYWRDNSWKVHPFDMCCVSLSARHKKPEHMVKYLSDTGTLYQVATAPGVIRDHHKVGVWKPCHIVTLPQYNNLNKASTPFVKPAPEQANWWVFEKMGVDINDRRNIPGMFRKICNWKPPKTSEEQLLSALQELVGDKVKVTEIMSLVRTDREMTVREAFKNADGGQAATQPIVVVTPPPGPAAKRQRTENTDEEVVLSCDFKTLAAARRTTKSNKFELYVAAAREAREQIKDGRKLSNETKSWLIRTGAILDCVDNCFGGSVDDCLAAFTVNGCKADSTHGRFSCPCIPPKAHARSLAPYVTTSLGP